MPEGDARVVRPGTEARIVSLYDGEIHYTDSQIARLFEALRDREIFESTLVVLTADHGEMLDEISESHGYAFDHGEYLFEANVRVPFIVKLPGGAHAGARVPGLASNMDVVRSPRPAPAARPPADAANAELVEGGDVLAAGRADADSDAAWLYDLSADPGESRDVLAANGAAHERLARAPDDWRMQAAPVAHQEVPREQRAALEALGYVQ